MLPCIAVNMRATDIAYPPLEQSILATAKPAWTIKTPWRNGTERRRPFTVQDEPYAVAIVNQLNRIPTFPDRRNRHEVRIFILVLAQSQSI